MGAVSSEARFLLRLQTIIIISKSCAASYLYVAAFLVARPAVVSADILAHLGRSRRR
ncbi:hypothetical protein GALMADRAFT_252943 [Galerina marginata CBS 339.88]|uniref:Uncharacterized protein n=1 Tax=Galerina marginata (strain CBS 339.88) TaxID=685588 RepID=A0A067SRQ0_GALM3|nr:hypothetical protein GALMADRAFT_252943 [Galerina marginata CBS 339.88]